MHLPLSIQQFLERYRSQPKATEPGSRASDFYPRPDLAPRMVDRTRVHAANAIGRAFCAWHVTYVDVLTTVGANKDCADCRPHFVDVQNQERYWCEALVSIAGLAADEVLNQECHPRFFYKELRHALQCARCLIAMHASPSDPPWPRAPARTIFFGTDSLPERPTADESRILRECYAAAHALITHEQETARAATDLLCERHRLLSDELAHVFGARLFGPNDRTRHGLIISP